LHSLDLESELSEYLQEYDLGGWYIAVPERWSLEREGLEGAEAQDYPNCGCPYYFAVIVSSYVQVW
jgi:hypothetical protein